MKLIVYGSSDDLIEVDGDVRDEFNGDAGLLTISDGTVLHIEYVGGVWEIEVQEAGTLTLVKHPPVSEDDGPRRVDGPFEGMSAYSEIAVFEGDGPVTVSWRQL